MILVRADNLSLVVWTRRRYCLETGFHTAGFLPNFTGCFPLPPLSPYSVAQPRSHAMLTENPAAAIEKKVSDFWVTTGDLSSSTPVEKAASPRALGIPEVLDVVLGYSSNGTLAVCTRVCSSWSSPSLDRLWRDMESIVPILELISPLRLVEKEDGSQQWVRLMLLGMIHRFLTHRIVGVLTRPFPSRLGPLPDIRNPSSNSYVQRQCCHPWHEQGTDITQRHSICDAGSPVRQYLPSKAGNPGLEAVKGWRGFINPPFCTHRPQGPPPEDLGRRASENCSTNAVLTGQACPRADRLHPYYSLAGKIPLLRATPMDPYGPTSETRYSPSTLPHAGLCRVTGQAR